MDKIVISFSAILENRLKLRPGAWAYKVQRDLRTLTVNSFAKFPNVARYGSVRDIRFQTWPGRHIQYAEMLFGVGRFLSWKDRLDIIGDPLGDSGDCEESRVAAALDAFDYLP